MEELADFAPGLGKVIGDRPLEVGRTQEAGPTLLARRRILPGGIGKGQGHPGISQELAAGIPLERQAVGRNQQPVAQLGDRQAMIRQGFVAVEEGPPGRADLVVVALRRGVHAELRRPVAEVVAGPVTQATLHGLEDAAPGGTPLRPLSCQRALRRQRPILVIGVVGSDPGAGQANLKAGQRLVDQRPDRRVEPHAYAVLGLRGRARRAEADIAMQAAGMGRDLAGLGFACVLGVVFLCSAGAKQDRQTGDQPHGRADREVPAVRHEEIHDVTRKQPALPELRGD